MNPAISIIIPCRNEINLIDRCLASVCQFELSCDGLEVLVVDGDSTDGTRARLAEWAGKSPNIRVISNPDKIVPIAMNLGIRAARGKWIVRLDAHSAYPADYLRSCIETAERTGADNVGGLVITQLANNSRQAKLVQSITTHRFGVGNAGYRLGASEGEADTVPYGCFRREVFDQIGGFDERLVRNQDYELNRRLLIAGGRIWRNPAIHVHYYNQGSLRGLLSQAWITGQWNPWTWYVAPYAFAWRHAIPAVFVACLFISVCLAFAVPYGLAPLAALLGTYLVAACAAARQQARRYRLALAYLLPPLFFAYHVTYGAGTLVGLARLLLHQAPVQRVSEPWPGAGQYRAWPRSGSR